MLAIIAIGIYNTYVEIKRITSTQMLYEPTKLRAIERRSDQRIPNVEEVTEERYYEMLGVLPPTANVWWRVPRRRAVDSKNGELPFDYYFTKMVAITTAA